MSQSVSLTLVGNLAGDPELRFTRTGQAVANFTVMTSRSVKDKATGEWNNDVDTTGWRCTAWGQLAENVAETLQKGTAVVVLGRAAARSYENREGATVTVMEVTADTVGADLRRATAKITRIKRDGKGSTPAGDDPWATGAAAAPWGGSDDEPPF